MLVYFLHSIAVFLSSVMCQTKEAETFSHKNKEIIAMRKKAVMKLEPTTTITECLLQ